MKLHLIRPIISSGLVIISISSVVAQVDYADKVSSLKNEFPKEDVIAYQHKQVINFLLNKDPAPGEAKVKAIVTTEVTLVPVKDYVKFEDGLFYNQQISVDNVKAIDSKGKEIFIQRQCGSYSRDDIFFDDTKLCVVKFPLEEKGKGCSYSYKETYNDVKYVTSFYFNNSIPAVEEIIEFDIPTWIEIDLREFNFQQAGIEKTTSKENDITKIIFRVKNASAYEDEDHSPNHGLFPINK